MLSVLSGIDCHRYVYLQMKRFNNRVYVIWELTIQMKNRVYARGMGMLWLCLCYYLEIGQIPFVTERQNAVYVIGNFCSSKVSSNKALCLCYYLGIHHKMKRFKKRVYVIWELTISNEECLCYHLGINHLK